MIDEDLEEPGPSDEPQPTVFNENLFDDADIPEDSDEDEEGEESQKSKDDEGDEETTANLERLKI